MIYQQARNNGRSFATGFALGSTGAVASLLAQVAITAGIAAAAAGLTAYRMRVGRMIRLRAEVAQLQEALVANSDRLATVEDELVLLRHLERSSGPLEASKWSLRIAQHRMEHYGNPAAQVLTRENERSVAERYTTLHAMRDNAETEGERTNIDAEIKLYAPMLEPRKKAA